MFIRKHHTAMLMAERRQSHWCVMSNHKLRTLYMGRVYIKKRIGWFDLIRTPINGMLPYATCQVCLARKTADMFRVLTCGTSLCYKIQSTRGIINLYHLDIQGMDSTVNASSSWHQLRRHRLEVVSPFDVLCAARM